MNRLGAIVITLTTLGGIAGVVSWAAQPFTPLDRIERHVDGHCRTERPSDRELIVDVSNAGSILCRSLAWEAMADELDVPGLGHPIWMPDGGHTVATGHLVTVRPIADGWLVEIDLI